MVRAWVALTLLWITPGCRINFDPIGDGGDDDDPTTALALVKVDIGARHICGLTTEGGLYCWGDNTVGQLGVDSDESLAAEPRRVGDASDVWTDVTAGGEHTCGVRGGEPWCWGRNLNGQVTAEDGDGALFTMPTRVAVAPGAPPFESVVAGHYSTCAIGSGQLWCWGHPNTQGNNGVSVDVATRVGTLADWTDVRIGRDHACGRSRSQGLLCWGASTNGETGTVSAFVGSPVTVTLPSPLDVQRVALAAGITCTTLGAPSGTRGELWCWGFNQNGLIHDPATPIQTPVRIGTSANWSAIAIGSSAFCGIDGGQARCWGFGSGVLGNGLWFANETEATASAIGTADQIAVFKDTVALSVNVLTACLLDGRQLKCWGDNSDGQFGTGQPSMHRTPTEVIAPSGRPWRSVVAASTHVCATDDADDIYCWGADFSGQVTLGNGEGGGARCVPNGHCDQRTPTAAPPAVAGADDIVPGLRSMCMRRGATVGCWGGDINNSLGAASFDGHSLTNVLPVSGQWTRIVGSDEATCGFASDGTLQCWGRVPGMSQLPTVMTQPELAGVDDLRFGNDFACAHRAATASRVCWGGNDHGQLGDGTQTNSATPIELDMGTVTAIDVGGKTACMIDTSTNVLCWGQNDHYQAGNSVFGPVPTPSVVSSASGPLTGCTQLAVGLEHSCVLCDGQPLCWGQGFRAALGRGTLDSDSLAARVAVPAGTYVDIAVIGSGGCSVEASGRLYCWGMGVHGEMGDGSSGANIPTPAATVLP